MNIYYFCFICSHISPTHQIIHQNHERNLQVALENCRNKVNYAQNQYFKRQDGFQVFLYSLHGLGVVHLLRNVFEVEGVSIY